MTDRMVPEFFVLFASGEAPTYRMSGRMQSRALPWNIGELLLRLNLCKISSWPAREREREREAVLAVLLFIIYEPTSNRVHDNLLLTRKLWTWRSWDHRFVCSPKIIARRARELFPTRFQRLTGGLVFDYTPGNHFRDRYSGKKNSLYLVIGLVILSCFVSNGDFGEFKKKKRKGSL